MNKKRLIRDKKWFFQCYPYHQMYMNNELLKGWVAIHYLTDGEKVYWEFEKAGKVPVSGKDMIWLTMIPEGSARSISAYFHADHSVSAWYVDVIEEIGVDEDGIAYFIDKYLDIMMTPQGDVVISDRDELDAAYATGDISKNQYDRALEEGERIIAELGTNIQETEAWCKAVLERAEEKYKDDHFTIFLDIDGVLDIYEPNVPVQKLLPEALENLKALVNRTKADVVVISDWRYGAEPYRDKAHSLGFDVQIDNWSYLEQVFAKEGIEIKGLTSWEKTLKSRTEEIKTYLQDHPEIRRYVILDDCYGDTYESDGEIRKHLVFVDALKGLQQKDLIAACEIMNRQE